MQIVILNNGKKEIVNLDTLIDIKLDEFVGDGEQLEFTMTQLVLNNLIKIINNNIEIPNTNYTLSILGNYTKVTFTTGNAPTGSTKFIYPYGLDS
jgi:hypothetical protein